MGDQGPAPAPDGTRAYMLNSDWAASSRLTYQHFVLKMREGWLIHPKIKSAITSQPTTAPLRIADVAAGNCIWSTEVISELPGAEVTAFDITAEAYPQAFSCPANLTLRTWNVFDPPPPEFREYFDVVHIRFVLGVVHQGGHEKVLANLLSMLKPGGWIQWQDASPPALGPINLDTLQPVPRSEWPSVIKFLRGFMSSSNDLSWMDDLGTFLANVGGCKDTENFIPPVKREVLKLECDMAPWLYGEILKGPFMKMMATEEGKKYKETMEAAMDEEWALIKQGKKAWSYKLVVGVGRKPTAEESS